MVQEQVPTAVICKGNLSYTHTLVKTLICALLSFQTVLFLMSTWSSLIAVRRSPEGNSGTVIVRLFGQFLTVVCPPAGCNFTLMLIASLLLVTKRFVGNSSGLNAWYSHSTASRLHRSKQNSKLKPTHVRSLAEVQAEPCKFVNRMQCHPSHFLSQLKIDEVISILSSSVNFLIDVSILFSLSRVIRLNC